jgi:hypothetical protein
VAVIEQLAPNHHVAVRHLYHHLHCHDEGVAFSVRIEKSQTVGQLKDLIKEESNNHFADTDSNSLYLYRVSIPGANEEDLMASVKAQFLDSPLLATKSLIKVFPDTPKADTVHFIVNPSKLHR